MRGELRLVRIFSGPYILVSMYELSMPGHPKDGKYFFCQFPSTWFENFDTSKATETFEVARKEKPDLIYEDGKLIVVKQT